MSFHDFLESSYMTVNDSIQKEYTTYRHAKSLATKGLIDTQRNIFKYIAYLELIGHFLLVKLHLAKPLPTAKEIFEAAKNNVEEKK